MAKQEHGANVLNQVTSLLDEREAATLLRVKPATVRAERIRGKLAILRSARGSFLHAAADYLERQSVPPCESSPRAEGAPGFTGGDRTSLRCGALAPLADLPADRRNTLARPSAILDLGSSQFDEAHGLLDLNPPGRTQNKKFRPILPVTPTLMPWLRREAGPTGRYVSYRKRPVHSIRPRA
jgi:hypothetical protein